MSLSDSIPETTIWAALERRAAGGENHRVLTAGGAGWTARDLREAAEELAGRLAARGIGEGSQVLTLLPNGIDHVVLFLALARLGALWAAIAPDQRGPALGHIVKTVEPALVIAVPEAEAALREQGLAGPCLILHGPDGRGLADAIGASALPQRPYRARPGDLRAVVFTSGTTGPPKGALVTERMLAAAAWGLAHASDATAGDRFLMWEPLYHIGGSQLIVLCLLLPIHAVLLRRFSASRFWEQNREAGITKLHYLGGILEMLLKQPPNARDRDHAIELGFGAGARPEVWRAFRERFGIPLREVYGLTEASSFTTLNREGTTGSIGKAMPWCAVRLVAGGGAEAPPDAVGEIVIRPKVPGLLTPGYLGDAAATAALIRGDELYTGDLARRDGKGGFAFVGRKRDAIRRRGELVSAWEVEAALLAHPDVSECAAVAVPAEVGEEEIMVFIRLADGAEIELAGLADWAGGALPRRSRPRYWRTIASFPRTPSARIAKTELPRDAEGAFDAGEGT